MALRPIQLDSTTTCVSVYDPAIDYDASEKNPPKEDGGNPVLAYASMRIVKPSSWLDLLKFTDGQQPTVFTLGVVRPGDLARIEDEARLGYDDERTRQLYWQCFLHGLRGLEHGPCADEKPPMIKRGELEYVDPAWLQRVFVGPLAHVALEVGQNIFCWQQFRADDAKN